MLQQWSQILIPLLSILSPLVFGTIGWLYIKTQADKDSKINNVLEQNAKISIAQVKSQERINQSLHELSKNLSLLEQALQHLAGNTDRKHDELCAHLARVDVELIRVRDKMETQDNYIKQVREGIA